MRPIIMAFISILTLTSCSIINRHLGLLDDNVAEEILEFRIETGFDVDLTPTSQE